MNKEERDLNFSKLFRMYLKKWWVVLLVTLLCAALMGGYIQTTSHQPYTQVVSKVMIVNADRPETQGIYETQNNIQRNIFAGFLDTQTLLEEIQKGLKTPVELKELDQMVTSIYDEEASLFEITVNHPNRELALEVSNKLLETSKIYMEKNLEVTSFNFFVLETKEALVEPTDRTLKAAVIGAVVGLFASVFILFIWFFSNKKLHNRDDIAYYLDLECLGDICEKNSSSIDLLASQILLKYSEQKSIAIAGFYTKTNDAVQKLVNAIGKKGKKVLHICYDDSEKQNTEISSSKTSNVWTLNSSNVTDALEKANQVSVDYDYVIFDLVNNSKMDVVLDIASTADVAILMVTAEKESYEDLLTVKHKFASCGINFASSILYR